MIAIVEALLEKADFKVGDRVKTYRGAARGMITSILPDGRVTWKSDGGGFRADCASGEFDSRNMIRRQHKSAAILLDEVEELGKFSRMRRLLSIFSMTLALIAGCSTPPSKQPATLRVMTFNIHHGEGTDRKVDLERIAGLIKENKVDLVALQEVDRNTERTGRRDFVKELSALTGLTNVFGKNIDLEGGEYGNAILSWYPILKATNYHLPKVVPGEQRGLLVTTIPTPMGHVVFCAVHLDHRRPEEDRLASIEAIHARLKESGRMTIVAGDFNATPQSETYKRMVAGGFSDAWERIGVGDGFTIPSENPRSRIDYVFYRGLTARSATVLNSNASDHLPLIAELVVW
jgi:endonuclease/exonuclease/phosphatase family metal-dependent hydrolase